MTMRIGQGFDVHAFGTGDHVVIGGVHIPFARGLVAHSDGDVLLHALSDALLGALALGDIGHFFPDSSQEWAGADSRNLLRQVMGRIAEQGYEVGNVDITIIAQAPKMAPHIEQMKINIADDLGISMDRVGVKATTTERLGFTGRGEGIACQAICLLNKVGS
jgi:2-C-methyl-D-erythritol 2,4-cyclodiphosphate synthase